MAQASLSADLIWTRQLMRRSFRRNRRVVCLTPDSIPCAAVDSAISVDPKHPFTQPHTDHRRTTRSEPPFFVPVTASSDARGRPFRTGSNTPCHTSGTRHSYMIRNPDPEWLSQRAAADREPDSALRRCRSTLRILKKMTICPQRAEKTGNSIKM